MILFDIWIFDEFSGKKMIFCRLIIIMKKNIYIYIL